MTKLKNLLGLSILAAAALAVVGGSARSSGIRLGGCDSPTIGTHPAHQRALTGASAKFSISADGSSTLKYQWRHNGSDLNNVGNISGADTDSLSINPVEGPDAGNYDCKVTNDCGEATSKTARLRVLNNKPTPVPAGD